MSVEFISEDKIDFYYKKNLSLYYSFIFEKAETMIGRNNDIIIKTTDGRLYNFNGPTERLRPLPIDPNNLTKEEFANEFRRRLNDILYLKTINQEQLAEKSGLTQQQISAYMTGKAVPSFYVIDKIAKVLNCSVDDFRFLL